MQKTYNFSCRILGGPGPRFRDGKGVSRQSWEQAAGEDALVECGSRRFLSYLLDKRLPLFAGQELKEPGDRVQERVRISVLNTVGSTDPSGELRSRIVRWILKRKGQAAARPLCVCLPVTRFLED